MPEHDPVCHTGKPRGRVLRVATETGCAVEGLLIACMLGAPIAAIIMETREVNAASERHHGHHDTYSVSRTLLSSLVVAMAFMAVIGLVFYWLCLHDVFETYPPVILAFFAAFVIVMFVLWAIIHRYCVVTYPDHMVVRGTVGRSVNVTYADITRLEWFSSLLWLDYKSVRVYVDGREKATCVLWGVVDVDQILMRVDRFDAFDKDGYDPEDPEA